MIFSFLFIITYLQQPGCAGLVFLLQILMYSELININIKPEFERECGSINYILWWWFGITSLLTYGEVFRIMDIDFIFRFVGFSVDFSLKEKQNLYLLCFCGYLLGLFAFALKVKTSLAKYQFRRLVLSHVVLLLVTAQSTAMVANMFEGLIWFLLPSSLVICNDIWAFIFGFFLGRTPLISLSPKKTWEGFLGGFIATFFFGYIFTRIFSSFSLMTCSRTVMKLEYWPTCEVDYPFGIVEGEFLTSLDKHMGIMALFASLIAPFGGFFASGFKRAFKIKDFGSFIPGHGGFVDRMDCQVLMGMFVFVYLNAFVIPYRETHVEQYSVEEIWQSFMRLSDAGKNEVYKALGKSLVANDIL